jgi:omega-amidase
MSKIAKELQVYIIAGSITEKKDEKFYNSCVVWGRNGNLLKVYRKIHLPDIEEDFFEAGNKLTVIVIDEFKIGIGICFDVRFSSLAKAYRELDCNLLVYPVAFSMKSGPLHAELLARSRALDSQCFTALISPARNIDSNFITWGYSSIVDPSGQLISQATQNEEILLSDLDLSMVDEVRKSIPIFDKLRNDIYNEKPIE